MIHDGQIVLFRFPQADLSAGKLRPALILRKLSGPYNDWLICMISSHLSQQIEGLDEIVKLGDTDFKKSGLKTSSLIRVSRLAVIEKSIMIGAVGEISATRIDRIKTVLCRWIQSTSDT